jgi:hypothetical protein
MTIALIAVVAVLAIAFGGLVFVHFVYPARPRSRPLRTGPKRILFPFVAEALSRSALDSALRLAKAEEATLVPVFLARVPLNLPLNTPLSQQSSICLPLQEAIEQRAASFGVPVDARIERGRNYRHALRHAIASQRYDRIVIAAAVHDGPGFGADDIRWLLDHAPGEIIALRPGDDQHLEAPTLSEKRIRSQAPRDDNLSSDGLERGDGSGLATRGAPGHLRSAR